LRSRKSWEARALRRQTPEFKEAQYFRQLERKLGMTKAQYLEMFKDQGGVCAICLRDNNNKRLCVDHDHRTGRIRGLLCNKCNGVLGYLDDNATLLRRFMKYLEVR
jgi:Autographiviridae endonuclease VII